MRWPWVSRFAYDTLAAERDRLREDNAKLLDHVTRIDRREHGLPETVRPEREPMDAMPESLKLKIERFEDSRIQTTQTREAYRRRAKGVPWATIEADFDKEGEDNGIPR